VEVPAVPYKEMRADAQGVTSDQMRERIERARGVEQARGHVNSELPPRLVRKLCRLDDAGERTLELAMRKMGLSARAHDRGSGRLGGGIGEAPGGGGAVSEPGPELLELSKRVWDLATFFGFSRASRKTPARSSEKLV